MASAISNAGRIFLESEFDPAIPLLDEEFDAALLSETANQELLHIPRGIPAYLPASELMEYSGLN